MRWLTSFRLPTTLPTLCAVCRSWADAPVCPACLQDHGPLLPRCPSCALPLAPGLALCITCREQPAGELWRCLARVPYAWPWTQVVAHFKFHGQPAWASEMSRMMLEPTQAQDLLAEADGLIPIPLTPQRQAERGYNQAWELAKHLSRASQTQAHPDALLRLETELVQHELPLDARRQHALRAFAVNPDAIAWIRGRHWVLVDDVMTTGATLRAAASHLLDAGAQRVSALVFARTPAPSQGSTREGGDEQDGLA